MKVERVTTGKVALAFKKVNRSKRYIIKILQASFGGQLFKQRKLFENGWGILKEIKHLKDKCLGCHPCSGMISAVETWNLPGIQQYE